MKEFWLYLRTFTLNSFLPNLENSCDWGLGAWGFGPEPRVSGVGLGAWRGVFLQTPKDAKLKFTIQPFSCEVKQQTVVLDVLQTLGLQGFSVRVWGLGAWKFGFKV